MVICLQQGANDLHIVQLMRATTTPIISCYTGCPGKKADKRM